MKRTLIGAVLLSLAGVAGVFVYNAAARDREYRRLIAQGEAALAADQTYAAIEAFSGALALKGDSMLAHLKRGETYRRRGDLQSALRDLRAAARFDPSATRPLEQLGDVNDALERYARAAESYEAFIRIDDSSPRLYYKLALARYRDGKPAAAVPALREAVRLDEKFAEAYYLLGRCLREQRRADEAIAALRRAVALSPALAPPREELVDLYRSVSRTREAIEQLEALAALDPARPQRQVAVGLAYASAGKIDLAVLTLGRAAERYPQQPDVYTALGRVWLQAAEARSDRVALSKAIEALQGIATRASASSDAMALYGRALFLSGDIEGAELMLQQAVAKLPVDPSSFLHLAAAAERLGDLALAREAVQKYVALEGEESLTPARAVQIGDLSLRLGDPVAAVEWFRRAADLSPAETPVLARLADAQWKAGDLEAARATLGRAIGKDPRNPALLTLARRIR